MAPYFAEAMLSLQDHELVRDIRTIGMMGNVEMFPGAKPGARGVLAQTKLFWNGCHVKFTGDNGIVAPMFIAEKVHIDEIIYKIRKTLDELPR